jgi:hypothetical protein
MRRTLAVRFCVRRTRQRPQRIAKRLTLRIKPMPASGTSSPDASPKRRMILEHQRALFFAFFILVAPICAGELGRNFVDLARLPNRSRKFGMRQGRCRGLRLYKTQIPTKETGFFLPYQTHISCVIFMIMHCRSHGSRNPGGLPTSMVSCFESRNREASDLALDALL